jgi:hypothetical protein
MKRFFLLAIIFVFSVPAFSGNVTLTQEKYKQIIDRLTKDKEIMQKNDDKWDVLRKEIPEINYKVSDEGIVVEKIVIQVKDDNPLEYLNEFKIISKKNDEGFIPLRLRLLGVMQVHPTVGEEIEPDVKLAIKLFGLKPLKIPVLQNLGLNVSAGFRGMGGSLSYDLPKPLANTSIHLFYGTSYKWKDIIGIGLSLNF